MKGFWRSECPEYRLIPNPFGWLPRNPGTRNMDGILDSLCFILNGIDLICFVPVNSLKIFFWENALLLRTKQTKQNTVTQSKNCISNPCFLRWRHYPCRDTESSGSELLSLAEWHTRPLLFHIFRAWSYMVKERGLTMTLLLLLLAMT